MRHRREASSKLPVLGRRRSQARKGVVALVVALATVLAVATPASAQGPLASNCEIDDDPIDRMCLPPEKLDFPFTANQVDPEDPLGDKLVTSCNASLALAAPPATDLSGRAQFRTSSRCNNNLKVVELDSKLLNSTGALVAESGRIGCHNATTGCGAQETPLVDVKGLATGTYTLQATVRFVLMDPLAPDPWTEPPPTATTPTDEPATNPTTRGVCLPGFLVIRCDLRLTIGVVDSRARSKVPYVTPIDGGREECRLDPFRYGCPLNPR